MTDENKIQLAQKVYKTLCGALDRRKWYYHTDESKLVVYFTVDGDDIPMKFILNVNAEKQIIRLMSPLPFKMCEEKRIDGAIAACAASYGLASGSFDYDISDGQIVFRMTAAFENSTVGEGLLHYMISSACSSVDRYNDQFLALDKGFMSIAEFIEKSR